MKKGRQGFSLLEVMIAIALMMLIVMAVSVPMRERWEKEQTRRSAQRIMLMWMKTQSRAFREGREWVVAWNPETSELLAMPASEFDQNSDETEKSLPVQAQETDLNFNMSIDRQVRLMGEEKEEEIPVMRFLGNGRARFASILVAGPKKDIWRVKMDWSGRPSMEFVSGPDQGKETESSGKKSLPQIKTDQTSSSKNSVKP